MNIVKKRKKMEEYATDNNDKKREAPEPDLKDIIFNFLEHDLKDESKKLNNSEESKKYFQYNKLDFILLCDFCTSFFGIRSCVYICI